MEVENIDVDLNNFNPNFNHDYTDIQVITEYIDNHNFLLIIRRLDTGGEKGWNTDINVFVHYLSNNNTEIISIGTSENSEKSLIINKNDYEFIKSNQPINKLSFYLLKPIPEITKKTREEFNIMFNTNIVILPKYLYAVGIKDNKVFMYNEYYSNYFCIIFSINHILRMILTFDLLSEFYFIISSEDGYIEQNYSFNRIHPKLIGEFECKNEYFISDDIELKEFPVFHKNYFIFAQANKLGFPYTVDVIDRHYFYCNLYNSFRSFHRGIPFSTKINKMIYGGRYNNGSKYNFINKDINMNQREYFSTDAVPKENIIWSKNEWIDSTEMIKYKYIIDIDGNGSTWDGTAWKLNSGSVIMKVTSVWRQWFYDEYKSWLHYVPIKNDLSDIQEQYKWCENNQDKCEEMIKNCKKLFKKIYRFHNVMEYTINKIKSITK